ncbi:MAG: HNH endonuclease [Desulfobacterales bacterium]|nr:HNH endonuclease [Desulfobacterales bacterium]MCP4162137.1 HNH endonuclease [Deltaproteobacteria bacterium]
MEKELTVLQLQGMLREMGIKFSAEETQQGLEKLLKAENHKKWLGFDEEGNPSKDKVVIRRRSPKKTIEPLEDNDSLIITETQGSFTDKKTYSNFKPKEIDSKIKILPEHFKNVTNVKKYKEVNRNVTDLVMRRADGSCELCEVEGSLKNYHILSLEDGGENTVKNIVALCSTCIEVKDHKKSDLKKMKKKARSRITKEITVVYKKK